MKRPEIQLVDADPERIPTAERVAAEQIAGARAILRRDITNTPRWAWRELDNTVGPMLGGDFVVVGALFGNGKSTLLMSQMDVFAEQRRPTLYFPLEIDPAICRLHWAAWKLGLDRTAVMRKEWDLLPRGAQDAIDGTLEEQKNDPFIHFATDKRVTLTRFRRWCEWARREFDAKVVMLDHLHRVDFGSEGKDHRVSVTDAIRSIKDIGRELDLVMMCAAQLNRPHNGDPIDSLTPPQISRLKETSAIAEEADVVLMLSRKLRRDMPEGWQQQLRLGQITEKDLAESGTMVVTCRKHRLDDAARDARVLLNVNRGRIVSQRT